MAPGEGFRLPSRFACVAYERVALAEVDADAEEQARREKSESSRCRLAIVVGDVRWVKKKPSARSTFISCQHRLRMYINFEAAVLAYLDC